MVYTSRNSTIAEASTAPCGLGCWFSREMKWLSRDSGFSSGGYYLLAVWEKGSADRIRFLTWRRLRTVLLGASYTKATAACMSWKWTCLICTKKLQVQEGKVLVVLLRTSDCETIFSFLFLRGLEETSQSLEPSLWWEHTGMESRITPSPPPPSTWQWSSIVAIVLLFTRQKTANWASRLGGDGSPRWKIPWQGED